MAFKESIAYCKDLITGRKIEKAKKKLIMPVTGVATVKLYDDLTHKQIYEAKSENRISAVFANIAFLETYYYPMLDNDYKGLERHIFTTHPFRVMTLTTGDIPEDPYDYWTWGDIVGYADGWYGYSGSDKLIGTVNKGEWSRTNTNNSGTRHFILDFPTHAANGTFRSIYWSGGSCDRTEAQLPNINRTYFKRIFEDGDTPNYNLCTDLQNLYLLKINSTEIKVYDKLTGAKKSNITLSTEGVAITFDGINFWFLLKDGSFKKLDKNFNVIESYSKSPTIPENLVYDVEYNDIVANKNYVYITYSGSVKSYSSEDYRSCIAVYNKDGNLNTKSEIYKGTSGDINLTIIPNEKLWVIINDKVCMQLNNDLSVYSSTSLDSTQLLSIHWDNVTQTLFTFTKNNNCVAERYIIPASAHTLLPELITKMPTNTMKIQYDFTCDYVYPLDMPTH